MTNLSKTRIENFFDMIKNIHKISSANIILETQSFPAKIWDKARMSPPNFAFQHNIGKTNAIKHGKEIKHRFRKNKIIFVHRWHYLCRKIL